MLIATVSDLHTDYAENRDALVKLAVQIHAEKADAVVVAGDVSHKNERIDRALRAFREAADTVAYVPGNHDLWYDVPFAPARPELDTWRRHDEELAALCAGLGVHYLPGGPLYLDHTAVVGCCGWYDYSLMKPSIRASVPDEALHEKQLNGVMWSDARFIAFRDEAGALMGDEAVVDRMLAQLEAHLTEAADRDDVRDVVAVTHHLAFEGAVKRTGTLPWEYFNAFMGSRRLGDVIRRAPKVRAAVYGHTHTPGDFEVDGIRVYGTPLGYPRERRGLDPTALTATRIGWIRT